MLWLIIVLPVLSIAMGAVTFAVALHSADAPAETLSRALPQELPRELSKTSWRTP